MSFKILLGTTNPAKIERFSNLLNQYDIEFITLNDLNIVSIPNEVGNDPKENAEIKARFYGQFFDYVICNDQGLYIDCLDFDDSRQPGLNIRSPLGKRLNDDEMIEYYSHFVHELGGQIEAYYVEGIAIYDKGKVYSYMDSYEHLKEKSFYMIDKVSNLRCEGWPLDSLCIYKSNNHYFVEEDSDEISNENNMKQFLDKIFKKKLR